jgi:hypothetical protein
LKKGFFTVLLYLLQGRKVHYIVQSEFKKFTFLLLLLRLSPFGPTELFVLLSFKPLSLVSKIGNGW